MIEEIKNAAWVQFNEYQTTGIDGVFSEMLKSYRKEVCCITEDVDDLLESMIS